MLTKMETRVVSVLMAVFLSITTVWAGGTTVKAQDSNQQMLQEVYAGKENETVIAGEEEMRLYAFIPETSGTYHFMATSEGDTCGYVYDVNQTPVDSTSAENPEFGFDLSVSMQAGETYYLGVDYYLDIDKGTVKWCIELQPVQGEDKLADKEETEDVATSEAEKVTGDETPVTQSQEKVIGEMDGDYEYRILDNGLAEITKYNGSATELVIPNTVAGKTVGSVGDSAFEGNTVLADISVPKTVTAIQYAAFANCSNLKQIKFADDSQLVSIGDGAFFKCSMLDEIWLPDNLETIGDSAFTYCTNMVQVVTGYKIRVVGDSAFAFSGVTSIRLPNTMTDLGESAFGGCYALESAQLGNGVKEIKRWTFYNCIMLQDIELSESLISIGEEAFFSSGLKVMSIPDSVTSIGDGAFGMCTGLELVEIGNGLAYISQNAFSNCNLKTITIGNKVKTIGDFAFIDNPELPSVTIPSNVTALEYGVFKNCQSLAQINIPETLEKINGESFANTAWLDAQDNGEVYAGKVIYLYKGDMPADKTIEVKKGTLGIAGYAFAEQNNLKNVIIPDSVTNIGEAAFFECSSMESISIPDTVKEIGSYAVGFSAGNHENGTWDGEAHLNGYYTKTPGFKIYGEAQSAAEAYASKWEIDFVKNRHKVVFKDGDKVIDTQEVVSGEDAVAPKNPEKEGYIFDSWNVDFTNVKGDVIVSAVWAAREGWLSKSDGWYYYENGKKVTGWKQVGDNYYYMDQTGLMAADTWIDEYYVDASGVWIKNYRPAKWIQNGLKWWYKNVDGSYPYSKWQAIDDEWYYFDASGYRMTGWTQVSGQWYYLASDGEMQTGWIVLNGNWYYLESSGQMKVGWYREGETWYYLDASGRMAKGWEAIGSTWYYFNSSGEMLTGKHDINGQSYLLLSSGAMVTGWNKEAGIWFYYSGSGAMAKGWLAIGETWYYCNPKTGAMLEEGWLNNTYYLKQGGAMAKGWQIIEGKWYYFTASGYKTAGQWIGNYYLKADGSMAVSEWVDNARYYVGEDGLWIPNREQLDITYAALAWLVLDQEALENHGEMATVQSIYLDTNGEYQFLYKSDFLKYYATCTVTFAPLYPHIYYKDIPTNNAIEVCTWIEGHIPEFKTVKQIPVQKVALRKAELKKEALYTIVR